MKYIILVQCSAAFENCFDLFSEFFVLLTDRIIRTMAKKGLDLISGYLAAIGGVITLCISAASCQALQGVVPDFQLSAARSFMQCTCYFLVARAMRANNIVPKMQILPLIVLSLVYVFYNVGEFGSTAYIALIETVGILNLVCILTSIIQTKFLFKIDLKKIHIVSFPVLIVGIVMISQPFQNQVEMHHPFQNHSVSDTQCRNLSYISNLSHPISCNISNNELVPEDIHRKLKGYILAGIGGIGAAMIYDINAVLLSNIEPITTAMYFSSLCFVVSLLISFYCEALVVVGNMWQYLFILVHCIASAMNTYFTIYSTQKIGGVEFSLVSSLQVILNLVVQYVLMGRIMPGHRNWMEVVGAIILVIGAAISPLFEMVQLNRQINTLP